MPRSQSPNDTSARRPFSLIIAARTRLDRHGADLCRLLVSADPIDAQATFVGRGACIECHQNESDAFVGSHHDLAMDVATDETVLGDFNDATLEHDGITSRMFRDGDRFMVHTEGPTGKMEDFQVKYVFGSVRCSSTWSSSIAPMTWPKMKSPVFRCCESVGILKRNDGFICDRPTSTKNWSPMTRCTGPASPNAGKRCAPNATRPT